MKDEQTHLKKIKHLLTNVFLSDCSTSLLHFIWMDTKGCLPVCLLDTSSCNKICEGNWLPATVWTKYLPRRQKICMIGLVSDSSSWSSNPACQLNDEMQNWAKWTQERAHGIISSKTVPRVNLQRIGLRMHTEIKRLCMLRKFSKQIRWYKHK